VVPIGEDLAVLAADAVERDRQPRAQPCIARDSHSLVAAFDDQVDAIVLDGKLAQPGTDPLGGRFERACDGLHHLAPTEPPLPAGARRRAATAADRAVGAAQPASVAPSPSASASPTARAVVPPPPPSPNRISADVDLSRRGDLDAFPSISKEGGGQPNRPARCLLAIAAVAEWRAEPHRARSGNGSHGRRVEGAGSSGCIDGGGLARRLDDQLDVIVLDGKIVRRRWSTLSRVAEPVSVSGR